MRGCPGGRLSAESSLAKRDLPGSERGRHGSEQQPAALRPGPGLPPGKERLPANTDPYALSLQCFIEKAHWAWSRSDGGEFGECT